MTDPYQTLGLPPESAEGAVRARYLDLVRQFPPEQAPARFAEIRKAFDALKDRDLHLRRRLFNTGQPDALDRLTDKFANVGARRRLGLRDLLDAQRVKG